MINKIIASMLPYFPKSFVKIFANKYIAGEELEDAVRVVKELNAKGIMATIDVLGEDIATKEEAISAFNEAKLVLDTIKKESLDSNISIKLSQFGLKIDKEFCCDLVKDLVFYAKEKNNFVRIDMEDSSLTDVTLEVYKKIRSECSNTGVAIQAYLKRTYNDVEKIIEYGPHFRFCKGIYVEDASIAIKDHDGINENYLKILKLMLSKKAYVGIATHDDYLLNSSKKIVADMKLDKQEYEFQMLLGVKPDARDKLVKEGHRVRIYVPFGEQWLKYSLRRLNENPKMTWYIIKSLFKQG
jgi:proline dehydrogenase